MINILLCDQNQHWLDNFSSKLDENMRLVDAVKSGREAQEIILNDNVDVLIINLATKNYSFFEVVKFVKQKAPRVMVLLLVDDESLMNEYFYSNKEIAKLGIAETYIKPFPIYNIVKFINASFKHHQWKQVVEIKDDDNEELLVKQPDHQFTSIPAKDFRHNNVAIFDLYIRLDKNKYIKVFKLAQKIDYARIQQYIEKDQEVRLFFKSGDRLSYINYTNTLLERYLKKHPQSTMKAVEIVEDSTRFIVQEIYAAGLPPHVIDEADSICDNMYQVVNRNKNLKDLLKNFFITNNTAEEHSFVTAFYTAIACRHVDWVTEHSRKSIIMGALVHDIGKIKLSQSVKGKRPHELSDSALTEYQKHPEYGVDVLDTVEGISEQVKQIVYQHHELNSGSGFPNGLTARKIYPLAKIVCFANFFAEKTAEAKKPPFQTLRQIVEERKEIFEFEPFVVKAMIKGFTERV